MNSCFFFYLSPLQIFGLIFSSKKQKKERRGNLQEPPMHPMEISTIEVQVIHWPLHRCLIWEQMLLLVSQGQAHPWTTTAPFCQVETYCSLNNQNRSFQQFLLIPQNARLRSQDCFQDTDTALDFVINLKLSPFFCCCHSWCKRRGHFFIHFTTRGGLLVIVVTIGHHLYKWYSCVDS